MQSTLELLDAAAEMYIISAISLAIPKITLPWMNLQYSKFSGTLTLEPASFHGVKNEGRETIQL